MLAGACAAGRSAMKLVLCVQHRFSLWNAPEWFPARLRQDFPALQVVQMHSYDGLERELADAEVLVTWSLRGEQFRAARRLRWIHSPAAAVHAVLIPEVVQSPVRVTNARDVHGPVVAEHAIALAFALAKGLHRARDYQHERVWAQQPLWDGPQRPRELRGATMLVIGLGAIGSSVARIASALGMHVIGVREHPQRGNRWVERVLGFDALDSVLREADFVVIAVPVTEKTTRLFDAIRLAMLKPSAYLINVARGAVVNEQALAEAVRDGRIAGAALDVFEQEPLPPDSPLWGLENVLITPHSAALSGQLWPRHYELLTENLRRFLANKRLLGEVDKTKGY